MRKHTKMTPQQKYIKITGLVEQAESELQEFKNQVNLIEVQSKVYEYTRLFKNKLLNSIPPEQLASLNNAKASQYKHKKLIKNVRKFSKDLKSLLEKYEYLSIDKNSEDIDCCGGINVDEVLPKSTVKLPSSIPLISPSGVDELPKDMFLPNMSEPRILSYSLAVVDVCDGACSSGVSDQTYKEITVPILNINQSTDPSRCDVDTIGHRVRVRNALSSVNLQESVREEEQSGVNENDDDNDGDESIRDEEQSNDSDSDRVSDHYLYTGDSSCDNCKRRNKNHDGSIDYNEVRIFVRERSEILKKKFFRDVRYDETSSDEVFLCEQCVGYLIHNHTSWEYMWPSFMWKLLRDTEVRNIYGSHIWSFFPLLWRVWWIGAAKRFACFAGITINSPSPFFKDISEDIKEMKDNIRCGHLHVIANTVNKHLMPTTLCPWGCSEYIHKVGQLSMDILISRFLPACFIKTVNKRSNKISSCRDDFIRDNLDEYDKILLNSSWRVSPKVAFFQGVGPSVLTCRNHNGGTSKTYIHVPRQPFHNLSGPHSDQLCHAVIKPRMLKSMKASKYSNSYQMSEQRGSFSGIDTMDICSFGSFNICSHFLNESESRSIMHRQDINALLDQLVHDSIIPSFTAQGLREQAKQTCPSDDVIDKYLHGSTYISLEDALSIQCGLGQDPFIKVLIDQRGDDNDPIEVDTKRNWIPHVVYCQKYDKNGFGAEFYNLPKLTSKDTDSFPIWVLSAILTRVKAVWKFTDLVYKKQSCWHGWLLTYLSKMCFSHCRLRKYKNNPFHLKQVNNVKKIIQKVYSDPSIDSMDLSSFFIDYPYVLVECPDNLFLAGDIDDELEVLIIVENEHSYDGDPLPCLHSFGSHEFELRLILSRDINPGPSNKWSGSVFSRHGGPDHQSWWKQSRNNPIILQTVDGSLDTFDWSKFHVAVYVKTQCSEIAKMRNDFLRYMGGQSHVICATHNLPLIVSSNNKEPRICDYSQHICTKNKSRDKISFVCPDLRCKVGLCKTCFERFDKSVSSYLVMNFSDDESSSCDACSSSGNENKTESDIDSDSLTEVYHSVLLDNNKTDNDYNSNNSDEEDDMSDDSITSDIIASFGATMQPIEGECLERDVVTNGGEYNHDLVDESDNEHEDELFPSTHAGDIPISILDNTIGRRNIINGHVIQNQCGSSLSRKNLPLFGLKSQQNFLQRLCSTTPGNSVPLLYPEGALMPSIFYKQISDGSILGALPSSLLTLESPSSHGFASVRDHIRNRLTLEGSPTCTNPRYMAWSYDSICNAVLSKSHSNLIMNRGLVAATNKTGLKVSSSVGSRLTDTFDSNQNVRNLCASQFYHKMDFFLTFTVNQAEHFGLKPIKKWIDENDWKDEYPNYDTLSDDEKVEVRRAVEESAAIYLLRNWMETKLIFLEYLVGSESSPYFPVEVIFSRDEYQSDVGNLPHIHLILKIMKGFWTAERMSRLDDLVTAQICTIIPSDEANEYIRQGVFQSHKEVYDIEELAREILTHRCNPRCLRRISDSDEPEAFVCRKPNNVKLSPDNTKHSYIPLPVNFDEECVKRFEDIGIVEPSIINKHGWCSNWLKSDHPYFNPVRHIPPTNPSHDPNMSPVNGLTFSHCKSMQNAQFITQSGGCNKYINKYLTKLDENNSVFTKSDCKDPNTFTQETMFIHNTKITSSKIQEEKKINKMRVKNQQRGRKISIMQMLQGMLGYPEVQTDMEFVPICSLPLEQRPGLERVRVNRDNPAGFVDVNDGMDTQSFSCKSRNVHQFPEWRQHRNNELLILQGSKDTPISLDKISIFSVRPPELRHLFDQVGNFYRWFKCEKKQMGMEFICDSLKENVNRSLWINGIDQVIKVRAKALSEIVDYLDSNTFHDVDGLNHTNDMGNLFRRINSLYQRGKIGECFTDGSDFEDYDFFSTFFIEDEGIRHLPVPVFTCIKPTMGIRFILHILISLGHFETEADLILHTSLRKSLRYAKLIGVSEDEESLKKYSNDLLKLYFLQQVITFPNSSRVIGAWMNAAADLFDGIIIRNEIPITDMPPVLQITINAIGSDSVSQKLLSMKKNLLSAALRELSFCLDLFCIPSHDELLNCDTGNQLHWDALSSYKKGTDQIEPSFIEQRSAIQCCVDAINQYSDPTNVTFTKCITLCGAPGSGKSFLLNYIALYIISKGLNVGVTAMMSQRAIHLGGIHIHKLFALKVSGSMTLHQMADAGIDKLLKDPVLLHTLKNLHVILIDEIGQVSAEMLAILDIILRKVRGCNIFFGGLLIISTLDHKQLPPVTGRPFMVSYHVISCFNFSLLEHSIRALHDKDFQRLQYIARLHPTKYEEDETLIDEFKELLRTTCTFVKSWNDPLVTPSTYRIYGKKFPAKKAERHFIQSVVAKLPRNEIRFRSSDDVQKRSHEEWQVATESTRNYLDQRLKCPRNLVFFLGAIFEFTYNETGKFSQSQICMMHELVSQETIDRFGQIPVLAAPPGLSDVAYDSSKSIEYYLAENWKLRYAKVAPEYTVNVNGCISAQRRQYGLKHHVTSTVHASMGDTLCSLATEISESNSEFKLWDKAQAIVLLSRTRTGKDLIFVGDTESTINALVSLIKATTQWTNYMEKVLDLLTGNQSDSDSISLFSMTSHPFRMCDIPLPDCNTGFVYMLISLKDQHFTYIGETLDIRRRIDQHNKGFGSNSTVPLHYRPFGIFAYICGFDSNKTLMKHVEIQWQIKRQNLMRQGVRCAKEFALSVQSIIEAIGIDNDKQLRLITFF